MKAWIVNTNTKNSNGNPNGFEYMLRQNKAAAYYQQAIKVDKIKKEDLILLYHNDNRIIAVGVVVKPFASHDFADLNIEHWVDVNWLWKATFSEKNEPKNPIDRNTLGITMVNNTVVNISDQLDYRALLEEIARRQNFL